MLKKERLIDDTFIKMMMSWRHTSGFSVHNKMRIKPDDEKGIENLSQYIIRNTFSLAKLGYNDGTPTVIYRSKTSHGKNKKNFRVFSPLEFIAAITQRVSGSSFQLVRYYGWYSNRMRGDRKKQVGRGEDFITISSVVKVLTHQRQGRYYLICLQQRLILYLTKKITSCGYEFMAFPDRGQSCVR